MGDEGRMSRNHIVASVAFLLSFLPLVLLASAATVTVCASGCNSSTVQGAIDQANLPGDEVLITDSGEYLERMVMSVDGITVRSNSTTAPKIRWSDPNLATVTVSADDVEINGIVFVYDSTDNNVSAIYVTSARNFTLRNNTISNEASSDNGYGVFLSQVNGVKIKDNAIRTGGTGGSNYGVFLSQVNNTEVRGNTIQTNGAESNYGVALSRDNNTEVRDNIIQTNGTGTDNEGVFVEIGSNVTIAGNNVSTYGDLESNIGVFFQSSSGSIESNDIRTNGSSRNYGLHLQSSPSTWITGNVISTYGTDEDTGENYGILIDSSSSSILSNNKISTGGAFGGDNLGLSIITSNGIEVSYCTINTSSTGTDYGLVFKDSTNNNTVSHSTINATLAPDVRDENMASAENFIFNTTFNTTDISRAPSSVGTITVSSNSVSVSSSGVSTTNNTASVDYADTTNTTLDIKTNATVSGAAVTVAKYGTNPGAANVGVTALGKYVQIDVDPAISSSLAWAVIKIFYTDAEVAAAGVSESTLRIYHLDAGTNTWTPYNAPDGGVNETGNFAWANTTHFSTFGVFTFSEPAPAPVPVAAGGGGGSGTSFPTAASQPATSAPVAAPAAAPEPVQPEPSPAPAAEEAVGVPAPVAAVPAPSNPITGFFAFGGNGTDALTGLFTAGGADPSITLMLLVALVGGGGLLAWRKVISKRKTKFHNEHEAGVAEKDSRGEDSGAPAAVRDVRWVEPGEGKEVRRSRKKDRD